VSNGRWEDDVTGGNIKTEFSRHQSSLYNLKQHKLFENYNTRIKEKIQQNKEVADMFHNCSWYGDEISFHDRWECGRDISIFWVATLNINGISSKNLDWLEWDILLENTKKLQIDSMGITELNVNFNNNKVTFKLFEKMKAIDRHMQLSISCSNQLNSMEKRGEEPQLSWMVNRLVEKKKLEEMIKVNGVQSHQLEKRTKAHYYHCIQGLSTEGWVWISNYFPSTRIGLWWRWQEECQSLQTLL
jgi:hypothetical protein